MSSHNRLLLGLSGCLTLVGATTAPAAAEPVTLRIAHVDARDYPTIRLMIVSSSPLPRAPHVTENGTPAAGLEAENLSSQASVVLAIDRSRSMRGRTLVQALAASRAFLAAKPTGYQVSIVTFGSQPLQLTPFSSSTADADSALRSITIDPETGTTIYDAVLLAAAALRSPGSPGRVIILITDGQNTTSTASLHQALENARRAQAIVYPIAIKDATYTPGPLRALARSSGGRMFVAAPGQSLASAYRLITSQLRSTWQISYLTPVRPGGTIHLTATDPTGGTASAKISIPGSSSGTSGGALPFAQLAIVAAAAVGLAAALAALRAIKNRRASGRALY